MSTDRRNGLTNEEEKSAVLWMFTGNRERLTKRKKSLILSVQCRSLGGGERSEDKRPFRGTKQVGAPRPQGASALDDFEGFGH